MALSADDQVLLTQYRAAYAALISGTLVARVTAGGRTVEYSGADKGKLESEIARLEAAATSCGTPRRRGAVRFSL